MPLRDLYHSATYIILNEPHDILSHFLVTYFGSRIGVKGKPVQNARDMAVNHPDS